MIEWSDEEWEAFEESLLGDCPEEMLVDLIFDVDDLIAKQVTIPFRLDWLWEVYKAMHRGGVEESLYLVYFGWMIHGRLVRAKAEDPLHALHSVWLRFGDTHGLEVNRIDNDDDVVLSFLYFLLEQDAISRPLAAAWGPILREEDPDPETLRMPTQQEIDRWRLRVDRFAERHGLPKVKMTRGPKRRNMSSEQS